VTAIECPMEQVDLTFALDTGLQLTTPRAHTPAGWITFVPIPKPIAGDKR
jgi:hypothetical protein